MRYVNDDLSVRAPGERLLHACRRWMIVAAAAIVALHCGSGRAQTSNWNTGSGDWNVGTNWTPSGVPTNATVQIIDSDSVIRTVSFSSGGFSTQQEVMIDQTGSGSNTLEWDSGNLSVNYVYVGENGQGAFTNFGTIAASSVFFLGNDPGSSGTFNNNAGTMNMGNFGAEFIGNFGNGTFNNNNGTNVFGTALYLGANTGQGTYTFAGGSISGSGPEYIGYSAAGTFMQTARGSNVVGGEVDIGYNPGSSGAYTIGANGGNLTVNGAGIYVGGSSAGAGGTGTLTVGQGATVNVFSGTIKVYPGAANSVVLNGGTLNVESLNFASPSQFHWNSGTVNLQAGFFVDSVSPFANLTGGTLTLQAGQILTSISNAVVGYTGTGLVNQSGGTNSSTGGGMLLGSQPNSVGTYNLSGGSLALAGGTIVGFAVGSVGTITQSGGTNVIGTSIFFGDSPTLSMGSLPGAMGTYTLSAGSLTDGGEFIGVGGTGVFNQSGGTNNIPFGNGLSIASNAGGTGTYTISGGIANVAGNVYVGGTNSGAGGTGALVVNETSGNSLLTIGGTLTVYPGSTLSLSFGEIQAGALDLGGNYSAFNWHLGTLELTNTNVALDSSIVGPTNPLGSALVITNLQTLIVDLNETIGGSDGAGSLTVNGTHIVGGTLTLNSTGTLTVNSGGSLSYTAFVQAGGIVNGTLTNVGSFTYQSGLFNGRLVNQGTVHLGNNFTAGNGIENDATMALAPGQILIVNGLGFDNLGSFTMTGGTIGGGTVTNDYGGTMTASSGTIFPTVTNNGTLNVTGVLTLGSVVNNGLLQVNGGANLRSPTLGSLNNNAGGVISGAGGAITMIFGNNTGGKIVIPASNSLSITGAWTNAGLVSLLGAGGILNGGTITNNSIIQGVGEVSAAVLNAGVINATGGELDLGGTGNTNTASGQIEVSAGATVLYLQGLATNNGIIALSGGTFDNGAQPLANSVTGMILGAGTLKTGGLTSAGSISLADSPSSVFGSLTTTTGGTVTVTNNTTTFFGAVTIGSGSTFTVNHGTARFLNTFTNSGTFVSDPSTLIFTSATVNSTGTIEASAGDLYQVSGNLANSSTQSSTWNAAGATLDFNGGGSHTLTVSGPVGSYGWGTLTVDAGNTLLINGNSATAATTNNAGTINQTSGTASLGVLTGTGSTVVNATASLTAYQIKQNSLTIMGNGVVTLLPSGSGSASSPAAPNNVNFSSTLSSLSIAGTTNAWTGTFDIGNNGLVIDYGSGSDPFLTLVNLVKSGYHNGSWTGTGITSSLARAAAQLGSPTPALNIGLIDFVPNTGIFGPSIQFEGQTITTSAVLVRLTYMDDLVLAGNMQQANATSDALFFAANYGSGTIWHVGDITHDGVIDTNDALLFAANYVVGLPSLDGTTGNAVALGGEGSAPAVPEPSTIVLAALAALGLTATAVRRLAIKSGT